MLNYANIEGDMRKSLWAECGKTATDIDGILYGKNQTENSYTNMFKRNPDVFSHQHIFREWVLY